MRFRPCIDLHNGCVKQIIGSTLSDDLNKGPVENFVANKPPSYYAQLFKKDNLTGGHVIMLGPGNEAAAKEALCAWKEGFQIGGGINADNAKYWLDQGAYAVIVTSYVFSEGEIREDRLKELLKRVGRDHLVLDLSCRKKGKDYYIVTNRWQKFTKCKITKELLDDLSRYCFEFLVHGVDVEGKCLGIDENLVSLLADFSPIPTTYAGGARSIEDLYRVKKIGRDRIDLTIGSALDIFGGSGVKYEDVVKFNKEQEMKNNLKHLA